MGEPLSQYFFAVSSRLFSGFRQLQFTQQCSAQGPAICHASVAPHSLWTSAGLHCPYL